MSRFGLVTKEPDEKLGHRVKLIHVIGRGIAREPQELEPAAARLAPLLHSARRPMEHRYASQADRRKKPVGCLRRAREGAGKDLGVCDEESLLAAYRGAREAGERREVGGVERPSGREHLSLRNV